MASSLRLAGAVAAGAILVSPLAAQKNAPATYAITNARLVPVSGPAIEKGTIVVRDGLIAAIGAAVTAPADAQVIDGTGLSIYPGLIDGYTALGFPAPAAANGAAAAGGRGGAAATPAARPTGAANSNYGAGLQPEVRAVDGLDPDATGFDAAHGAGITTALTASAAGIYRGQSALINLRTADVNQIVLRSGLTQNMGFSRGGGAGFGGGGGGYPGSLMGVITAIRQELFDAQHYRDVKAAYDKNPRGMKRPEYDPSLEALLPVLARTQAVVMQANTEREIIRALDIAKEFNIKLMIAGGAEAQKVIDRLKAEDVTVLLSLNFPEKGGAAGAGGRGGGGGGGRGGASPDEPEPISQLRARVEAPKAANALAAAGVKFVFESGNNYTGFLNNLRKATNAGLPQDLALKAMTTQPAELFGVADRLGTLEVGKIANLTILRGDLFDSASRVTQLFVDGQQIVIPATPAAGGNGGGRGGNGGGQ